ncbi:hypothetical protein GOV06_00710 [Candidatus Woesearchaeota archaeon]|nr:hypothetical protein [Candidatus Woesearchaeota archaeon]
MKFPKFKKSQVSTLAMIIIVVASALVIGAVIYRLTKDAGCKTNIEACRFSILLAAESKRAPKPFAGEPYSAIKCPRDELCDLTIKKKDIVEDGLINQDKAHKLIADAMAECWYMVGEGKIDPFSYWDTGGQSYCLVCKTIKFDDALLKYYKETLTKGKIAEKRGKNGVILSPIPYMLKKEYRKGETYFEYIYHEKGHGFSQEDIKKMNENFLVPESQIIVKLYRPKDMSTWTVIATWGVIIAGVVITIVGVVLTLTGVGAIIGTPLTGAGIALAKIGIAAVAVGATISIIGGIGLTGVCIWDPVYLNPFSECAECKGIGSMKLIPPDFDLYQEVKIDYGEVEVGGEVKEVIEEGPYCGLLIN